MIVLAEAGSEIARVSVAIPPGAAAFVPLYSAMVTAHTSGALRWRYTPMGVGERGPVPVVVELAGIVGRIPSTAWIATHKPAGGRPERFNVGVMDVDLRDGDVLQWQLWQVAALPAVAPAPPDTRGEELDALAAAADGDEDADDAEADAGDEADAEDDDAYAASDAAWAEDGAEYDDAELDELIAQAAREREAALGGDDDGDGDDEDEDEEDEGEDAHHQEL